MGLFILFELQNPNEEKLFALIKYKNEDGWAEADNSIDENVLRMFSQARKNFLFFGSDNGGKPGTPLHSLIGKNKLNSVKLEGHLRYVLDVIAVWPVNRVSSQLPYRIALTTR
ncbi:transposase [Enterobacter roggenkampii]|nr:transposase [Enterobacter roggenkampii]